MDNITFAEAEAGERELWGWIAETGGRFGTCNFWPGWGGYDRKAANSCFACEVAHGDCLFCPTEWPGGVCCDKDGLYDVWYREEDPAARKFLAAAIRDLPWEER
jgi:hypothetical protein